MQKTNSNLFPSDFGLFLLNWGKGEYLSYHRKCIQINLDSKYFMKYRLGAVSWLVGLYQCWNRSLRSHRSRRSRIASCTISLRSRITKIPDCSTGPLALPLPHLLARLVCLLCTPRFAHTLCCTHSFAHSLTSLTPSLVGQWMIG